MSTVTFDAAGGTFAGTDTYAPLPQSEINFGEGIPAIQRWTGTAWVAAVIQRWNGAAWVKPIINRYDGTGFVPAQ